MVIAGMEVSIPQAVSTVATEGNEVFVRPKGQVSIPQAVSTVATDHFVNDFIFLFRFQYRKR